MHTIPWRTFPRTGWGVESWQEVGVWEGTLRDEVQGHVSMSGAQGCRRLGPTLLALYRAWRIFGHPPL